jgi:hypothetical protein
VIPAIDPIRIYSFVSAINPQMRLKSNIMLDYPIVKCIFQIMQNKINNQERGNMTKIRMNTELRNKLFNKIKNVFENEDTQEREAFLQAREDVDYKL